MIVTIDLPDTLVQSIRHYGNIESRSFDKQVEHWLRVGKVAEGNSDLPYDFIKDILLSLQEADFSSLEETAYLSRSPRNLQRILDAMKSEEVYSWEEVKNELHNHIIKQKAEL